MPAKPPKGVLKQKYDNAYISFNQENKENVLSQHSKAVALYDGVLHKSIATYTPDTRTPFSRYDYARQRPADQIPTKFRDVIHTCRNAYLRVGVVRNVIDLMTDFACEDLKIVHPDKKVEALFKVWMSKIGLNEVINQFARHLLVDGNVAILRSTAQLTRPVETQWTEKTMGDDSPEKLYTEHQDFAKREIPWRYTFLNVAALDWLGDETNQAQGGKTLIFRPSATLLNKIRNTSDSFQKQFSDTLPTSVIESVIKKNNDYITLDMTKISVSFNKKDDWEDWAPPFLYGVLGDIRFKDKLRQAENAALDGWINVIRLWKLGDHTAGLLPGEGAIQRLIDILNTNTGGGTMDIAWDSMIDMEPFYPPIEQILGPDKYTQVNRDILIGLGVPDVLLGGQGANFSNSFIQLKTLIEKLNYIRGKIIEWLDKEIFIFCTTMDIALTPKVRFGQMNLEDENTTRKLIVGLLDRGVISVEAVLEAYGEDYLIEVERMRQEKALLKGASVKPKGPFDPKPVTNKPKGQPGGRPITTKDSSTRDQRTPKPRRTAELILFASDAIDTFDEFVLPVYMEKMNVSNARKLTSEQKDQISLARTIFLSSIKPTDQISEETIFEIIGENRILDGKIAIDIDEAVKEFASQKGYSPTVVQRKRIESIVWANHYGE